MDNALNLERRLRRASSRVLEQSKQTLQGLARALPRADPFRAAAPAFRFAAERLPRALYRNLQRS